MSKHAHTAQSNHIRHSPIITYKIYLTQHLYSPGTICTVFPARHIYSLSTYSLMNNYIHYVQSGELDQSFMKTSSVWIYIESHIPPSLIREIRPKVEGKYSSCPVPTYKQGLALRVAAHVPYQERSTRTYPGMRVRHRVLESNSAGQVRT